MSNDPIYKAQNKPYTEDINDLVEKGGEGSGKKGHITVKPEIHTIKLRGKETHVTMHQANHKPGKHLVAIHNRGEGDHGDIHEIDAKEISTK